MLVFFGWTAAEAVFLYHKLAVVLGNPIQHYVWKAGLTVWCKVFSHKLVALCPYDYLWLCSGSSSDYCYFCGTRIRVLCQPLLLQGNRVAILAGTHLAILHHKHIQLDCLFCYHGSTDSQKDGCESQRRPE
ncbi:hypothetical protein GBAR_LOCUS21145 [Geodia barretti]|uniref:Uncharacterized protein n=1 Tax=Geodia barretti TaxID=519541 RepID=A0AA35SXA2_GEOBA|nr:hypothetical protein GBAR_LOCUS21145 [Geodia barretti]